MMASPAQAPQISERHRSAVRADRGAHRHGPAPVAAAAEGGQHRDAFLGFAAQRAFAFARGGGQRWHRVLADVAHFLACGHDQPSSSSAAATQPSGMACRRSAWPMRCGRICAYRP